MFGNRRAEVDKALEGVDFEKNTYQIEFDTTCLLYTSPSPRDS